MVVEKRAKRKKRGRPATGKRPVIAMRIHPDTFEQIRSAAAENKLSISEEAARRLDSSLNTNVIDQQLRDAEDRLNRANDRIDELENLLANIKIDMQAAVMAGLAEAGLLKGLKK